jgi:hypothetical protein
MAIFETPWYFIDTDDFETEKDVVEMIHDISHEKFSLCEDCPNSQRCDDNDEEYPADDSHCIRRKKCRVLDEVIAALQLYAAVLKSKDVA